jgi:hypothetical protein
MLKLRMQTPGRHIAAIAIALLLFAAAVSANDRLGTPLAAWLPIAGVWLVGAAGYCYYCSIDEYQRLVLLKVFAASAALTMGGVISWRFLEKAGLPPLTSESVLTLFCGLMAISALALRRDEMAGRVRLFALAVLAAGLLAAAYQIAASLRGWPGLPLVAVVPSLVLVLWAAAHKLSEKDS